MSVVDALVPFPIVSEWERSPGFVATGARLMVPWRAGLAPGAAPQRRVSHWDAVCEVIAP